MYTQQERKDENDGEGFVKRARASSDGGTSVGLPVLSEVMAGREVREYTNLSDPKDKKWGGKGGKDKTDDEDLAFKRMVAKGIWRGTSDMNLKADAGADGDFGFWRENAALDSDDLLFLSLFVPKLPANHFLNFQSYKAASLADASPLPAIPPIRVEPRPRSGIRQHDLLKSIVEVKPKRHRISGLSEGAAQNIEVRPSSSSPIVKSRLRGFDSTNTDGSLEPLATETVNGSGLLGLAYETSDDDEESSVEVPKR
ncbi:hypothetical protein AXG93_4368s1390 [Marchantia polymorpha subsp. ruderalis]|uniref:Uncharacterized protein n=1 Tax=Marchantia polymorpha subsp. ruderalis TaxID=1480154 RepID=A0A176VXZ1_MARPO|nr:hypothetical protein AXG93_4368s1390 [Marchantia polymorpha subsp. ruderalis]